jgi:hypothetical protein
LPPPWVPDLQTAGSYAVLCTAAVTTGAGSVIDGYIGTGAAYTDGGVTGSFSFQTDSGGARADMEAAYAFGKAVAANPMYVGMMTFTPGVHSITSAFGLAAGEVVTLIGDGHFLFQINAAFTFGAGARIELTEGAKAYKVYWQVTGALVAGAAAHLQGTFLVAGSAAFGAGVTLNGRLLAQAACSLGAGICAKLPDMATGAC